MPTSTDDTQPTWPVVLSPSAIGEIKRIIEQTPISPALSLRIGIKGGGCSGLSYVLDFEPPQPTDIQMDIEGIRCILNPAHEMYLYGMEINWDEGLNSRGFTFSNPNAKKTCGCGSSFSA